MSTKVCPKCEGEMEEAMVTAYSQGFLYRLEILFAPIKKRFWGGYKSENSREISRSYACKQCGYVEMYL